MDPHRSFIMADDIEYFDLNVEVDDDSNDGGSDNSGSVDEEEQLSREFLSLGLKDDLPHPIVLQYERATIHDFERVSNTLLYLCTEAPLITTATGMSQSSSSKQRITRDCEEAQNC